MPIERESIASAASLIAPYIRRTPVVEISGSEMGMSLDHVSLKLEQLQRTGSFKTRGAFNNLLTRTIPDAGVVAASGGNHGAAVAFAAQQLGIRARVYVPEISSPAKIARIKSCGADLVVSGERYADALEASKVWQKESGAISIHAYDQEETIVGQGTVGKEFQEQVKGLDTLLVAVGGGGLIGGIATWFQNNTAVIGVEPESAPTLTNARAAGKPIEAPAGGIAADSLAPRQIGERPFRIAKKYVASTCLVTDDAILSAQRFLWDQLRLATEPGGAAAFSALLSGAYVPQPDESVGVVICGGNTDAVAFG